MLIKGDNPENIKYGDTLGDGKTEDQFPEEIGTKPGLDMKSPLTATSKKTSHQENSVKLKLISSSLNAKLCIVWLKSPDQTFPEKN